MSVNVLKEGKHVALLLDNTLDDKTPPDRLAKIFNVDVADFVYYGNYKHLGSSGRHDLVYLVPLDTAKKIGAEMLTWKLKGWNIKSAPKWWSDVLKQHSRTIPRYVKKDLRGCVEYGGV
jgi:hypothetical protein